MAGRYFESGSQLNAEDIMGASNLSEQFSRRASCDLSDWTNNACGRIVTYIDSEGSLHLVGGTTLDISRDIADVGGNSIVLSECFGDLTDEGDVAMGMRFVGADTRTGKHEDIELPDGSVATGGAIALLVDNRLYVSQASFSYGPVTYTEVLACVQGSGLQLWAGPGVDGRP